MRIAEWPRSQKFIASAFASGRSWAGTIEGHSVYCPPPTAALTRRQLIGILERFVADNPDSADKNLRPRARGQLAAGVPVHARLNDRTVGR